MMLGATNRAAPKKAPRIRDKRGQDGPKFQRAMPRTAAKTHVTAKRRRMLVSGRQQSPGSTVNLGLLFQQALGRHADHAGCTCPSLPLGALSAAGRCCEELAVLDRCRQGSMVLCRLRGVAQGKLC